MPSRPLWKIPDPLDAERQAQARLDAAQRQKRDREGTAKARRAKRVRDAALAAELETKRRAREREEWIATHPPLTADDLARALAESREQKGENEQ